jgi:hypothetical protein
MYFSQNGKHDSTATTSIEPELTEVEKNELQEGRKNSSKKRGGKSVEEN